MDVAPHGWGRGTLLWRVIFLKSYFCGQSVDLAGGLCAKFRTALFMRKGIDAVGMKKAEYVRDVRDGDRGYD